MPTQADGRAGVNSYDLVPYPGVPIPRSHCRRLEAVAALFGVVPAPLASARILELGCGCGANLLPQALEYPAASFVGCDAAGSAIASARTLAQALGLENVELRHQDLCDVDASWGRFDYIICNGVYSWVGAEQRRRILEVLHTNLAPQGVGYVSYNALPGWHLRLVVRELLCYHAAGFDDPPQAIAQAREILALAAEAQHDDSPYAALIREEYFKLSQAEDWYLYHEMLEEHNQPVSVQEFFRQADSAGLQYLGAADLSRMFTQDLPPAARAFLDGLPLEVREHYLDFLRGTAFRRDLLCHRGLPLDRRLDPRDLDRFSIGLTREARLETGADGVAAGLRLRAGRCELPCPDSLAAALGYLGYLDKRRPEFVPVQRLREYLPQAGDQDGSDQVMRFFMDAVTAGALEVTLSAPRLTSQVSERPTASPLARLQAGMAGALTNLNHEPVRPSDLERLVVRLLDGTRDRRAVMEAVEREVKSGRVSLRPLDEADDAANMEGLVERVLRSLARNALLVA